MAGPERNMPEGTSSPEGPPPGVGDQSNPNLKIPSRFEGLVPRNQADSPANNPEEVRPSPIPGLTAEEVELLGKYGTGIDDLKAALDQHGPDSVLEQARVRVAGIRQIEAAKASQPQLTPEQQAEQAAREQARKAEEKAHRIEKLNKEYQELLNRKPANQREERYMYMRKAGIERELAAGGDGNGPPETTQGAEGEEGPKMPEWIEDEASPERGRQIITEISKWEAMRAAGEYRQVDWKRLDELYLEHQIHMEACRLMSLRVSPKESESSKPLPEEALQVDISKLKDAEGNDYPPLQILYQAIRLNRTSEISNFNAAINAYFGEAKRIGLFTDLDAVLSKAASSVKIGIGRGQTTADLMPQIEHDIQVALNSLGYIYEDRKLRGDENMPLLTMELDDRMDRLTGVGDLYARLAKQRLVAAINGKDASGIKQRDFGDHEFHFPLEGEEELSEETYWKLEHGWYITIYAQTKEEFMIAADSFLSRLELITAAPEKIFQDATQFIDVLYKSEGAKKLLGNEKTKTFIPELILSMEARIGMFGADNSNERYDAESYKKFLDFINKDAKGPERYLELMKLMEGNVAVAVWMADKDPRKELLFSLHGSRGQLAESSYSQRDKSTNQGLYNQLYEEFVEEMLGVQIKNRDNLGLVNSFMTDRVFVSMFDGLYRYGRLPEGRSVGDANTKAWEQFKDTPDNELTAGQRRAKRLGRIQTELKDIRTKILNGEKLEIQRGDQKKIYDPLKDDPTDLLEKEGDANFYRRELSKARKAVDIALQLYGTIGEKSKRGGGVFTVSKVDADGQEHQDFVPIHEAEKFIQCGETMTKIKYGDDAEIWNRPEFVKKIKRKLPNGKNNPDYVPNFRAKYRAARCEDTRKINIDEFQKHGFEAKLVEADYDVNGNEIQGTRQVMQIVRPKENPAATDDLEFVRDARGNIVKGKLKDKQGNIINEYMIGADGKVEKEKIEANFYNATHHPYANWSGHTYWSYQEEHRHLLLSPRSFKEAEAIRAGELAWEDADPVSVQLLILDPTLKRVKRFAGKQFVEREGKLTMAAVEDSYQSHWRINRELYEAFWPKYGTPSGDIGVYYGLQDFGGFRKTVEHMKARFAENPERFMRRGRRLLPVLHNPIAALSEYMGQGASGALDTIRMMGYPTYRLVGTMALDKFSANSEAAKRASDALEGYTDQQGNFVEGLLLKLTNESDELQEFWQQIPKLGKKWLSPDRQFKYRNVIRKSLGRLEKYLKVLTVMETRIRNASGALWLEGVDILTDDMQVDPELERRFAALPAINANIEYQYIDPQTGETKTATKISRKNLSDFVNNSFEYEVVSVREYDRVFNEEMIDEGSTSTNTGSGRISARLFNTAFFVLLRDEEKRGGGVLYKGEKYYYAHTKDKVVYYDPTAEDGVVISNEDIEDWFFGKAVAT